MDLDFGLDSLVLSVACGQQVASVSVVLDLGYGFLSDLPVILFSEF